MDEFTFLKNVKGETLFRPVTENTRQESSNAGTSQVFVRLLKYHLSPQRTENEHLLNFLVWQRMREQPLGPSESPHLSALLIVKQSGTLRLKCDVRIQGAFLQTAHMSTVSLLSVTGPGASTTTL